MRPNTFSFRLFQMNGTRFFSASAIAAVLAVTMNTVAAVGPAEAQCRKNYYPCTLNAGGVIDPANPGCCWSPLAGPPSVTVCRPGYYECDLNAGGRLDPLNPGCCLQIP